MSPYTVTFRNSVRKDERQFAFLYDAKNYLTNQFFAEADIIFSRGKQEDFNVFISLPSGLRVNVAASVFNPTTTLEVSNIIRNAAHSAFYDDGGKNKLTVHLRHISVAKLDQHILFTLSYNPEADDE